MKPQQQLALVLCVMLAVGIALIAHGTGVLGTKWSVGVTIFGAAVSWIALELLDRTGGRHL